VSDFSVVGIDSSSFRIALAILDENENRATTVTLELEGKTAFDRLRTVPDVMPQPGWWESHGVYLVAIEMPKSGFYPSLAAQLPVFGAVTAAIPSNLDVWSVAPSEWRAPLSLKIRTKPTRETFHGFELDGEWSQDAHDALGVALYARETMARGIARAASGPVPAHYQAIEAASEPANEETP
jgi:hypothetical protein